MKSSSLPIGPRVALFTVGRLRIAPDTLRAARAATFFFAVFAIGLSRSRRYERALKERGGGRKISTLASVAGSKGARRPCGVLRPRAMAPVPATPCAIRRPPPGAESFVDNETSSVGYYVRRHSTPGFAAQETAKRAVRA